jgi:septal ring factor EnvC (AmiA/AmiB activator)
MGINSTILIGLAVLVLSVFASAWLNLRQIERMIDSMKSELKAEIRAIDQKIDQKSDTTNHRLTGVETRIERIERQLDSLFKPMIKP